MEGPGDVLGGLVDLIFPPRCVVCDLPGVLLCPSCAKRLRRIPPCDACPRCGAPAPDGRCPECAGRSFAFAAARAVGVFEPPLSRLVTVYKDAGERRIVPLLGALLAETIAVAGPCDAIVPVPSRPEARSRRGFDHMLLVARDASVRTGVPVRRMLRAARGADQRLLGRQQRRANAEGRFSVLPGAPRVARVLLVDDVFTTGATLDACAQALLAVGVERIEAVVVARACAQVPHADAERVPCVP